MAEISSPISGGIQIARSTVSSSTFGIGRSALQPIQTQPDPETLRVLRENQNSLLLISNQIQNLSFRMNEFRNSLEGISSLISNESIFERQRELQNQQQEKQLAEQQLREGKESIIEKRIQAALLIPVQTVGEKVRGTLGSLMEFFTTLLGGWLINQGVETIKALSENNKEKLEQIKDDTLGQLGIIGRIFTIIKTGFFGVFKSITSLTGRIVGAVAAGLFINPMRSLIQGIRGGGRGGRTPPPRGPQAPRGGGIPGGISGILTGVSGLLNLINGEYFDAALLGLSLLPGGKLISAIRVIAGVSFTLDEIAEAFGGNIFGKDPNKKKLAQKISDAAKQEAEKEKQSAEQLSTTSSIDQENKNNIKPTSAEVTPTSSISPTTSSKPTMSMMPEVSNINLEEPTKIIPVPGLKNQTEEEKNNFKVESIKPKLMQEKVQTLSSLSEPKPNIVMMPPAQQSPVISGFSGSSGQTNTVPAIQSSNPENFYVLYSQIHYNVVM